MLGRQDEILEASVGSGWDEPLELLVVCVGLAEVELVVGFEEEGD